jgi:uncharacterized protein
MKTLRISGIKLALNENENSLRAKVATILDISVDNIASMEIIRKAIDARRHRPPHFVYVIKVSVSSCIKLPLELEKGIKLQEINELQEVPLLSSVSAQKYPVVVVGSGPAGLFASYILTQRGIKTLVLERGTPVEQRVKDVEDFWRKGVLNSQSNVFFGEGGAGTFSDGKLTNRADNPYSFWVKKILVEMGAPPEILSDAKPHIGTDKLRQVIVNLRKKLSDMGCRIDFGAQVTDFLVHQGEISAIVVNRKDEIKTNHVILAIGQSADDTYAKLFECGFQMKAKPYAMGLRVEHPQELINSMQYGKWRNHPQLPSAEYFIKASLPDLNRSVYTFCMCPGGSVIGCSAFEGFLITNGMSNARRSGKFANSAIVVNVSADDFVSGNDPLEGLKFRQIWERKAFLSGGSSYHAPAQKMMDFLQGRKIAAVGKTSFMPGVKPALLQKLLPEFIINSLKRGIAEFDKKMPGFITQEANLIGVETRTSSPVRICRRSDGQSENIRGLYPCGEGAGYAGGIISSALDGIKAAQNLIENLN